MDTWRITPEDRGKYDMQFTALKPVNGFIKGEQAKGFLIRSGLPPQVLGQIWDLADMNSDGMMDKKEFSVAMFLIQKKLQGFDLPKTLPESLKADPNSGFSSPGGGFGGDMKQRAQTFASPAVDRSTTMMTSPSHSAADWAIPPQNRARYQQAFVARDTNRRGHLTGAEARGVLMESGLPQHILAQIWNLSDIDNDGKLTPDEFMLAMFLIESTRAGQPLPATLPPNLVPPTYRKQSPQTTPPGASLATPPSSSLQGLSMGQAAPSAQPPQSNMNALAGLQLGGAPPMGGAMTAQAPPAQPMDALADLMSAYRPTMTSPPPNGQEPEGAVDDAKSFEDRRKENFDKGQAELERRRALLREQQKADEEARLALERAEQEKREKARLEQEMKKQKELEKQMQRQRELEQEREEQRRKAMEQREAARRELERQRQVEWERQRMEQLTVEKNRIQEEVLALKSHNSNMGIELETLENKKNELVGKIEQSTVSVKDITTSIERMRQSRDVKLADIDRLQTQLQSYELQAKRHDQEVAELTLQLETSMESNPVSDSYKAVTTGHGNKQLSVQKQKLELEQIQTNTTTKQADLQVTSNELQAINQKIADVKSNIQQLLQARQAALQKQQQQQNKKQAEQQQQQSWFDTFEDKSQFSNASASPAPGAGASASADLFSGGGSVTSSTGPVDDSWATFVDDAQAEKAANKSISQGIWEDAFSSKDTSSSANVTAESEIKTGITRYRALYPFEARHQDELTINPGDIIMVKNDQSGVDKDWMGGEINGKYGWFPEAYVEKVRHVVR